MVFGVGFSFTVLPSAVLESFFMTNNSLSPDPVVPRPIILDLFTPNNLTLLSLLPTHLSELGGRRPLSGATLGLQPPPEP